MNSNLKTLKFKTLKLIPPMSWKKEQESRNDILYL